MVGIFAFIGVNIERHQYVVGMGSVSDRMRQTGNGEEQVEQQQDDGEGFHNGGEK